MSGFNSYFEQSNTIEYYSNLFDSIDAKLPPTEYCDKVFNVYREIFNNSISIYNNCTPENKVGEFFNKIIVTSVIHSSHIANIRQNISEGQLRQTIDMIDITCDTLNGLMEEENSSVCSSSSEEEKSLKDMDDVDITNYLTKLERNPTDEEIAIWKESNTTTNTDEVFRFSYKNYTNCSIRHRTFCFTEESPLVIRGARFEYINWENCVFTNVYFKDCAFINCYFNQSSIIKITFDNCYVEETYISKEHKNNVYISSKDDYCNYELWDYPEKDDNEEETVYDSYDEEGYDSY